MPIATKGDNIWPFSALVPKGTRVTSANSNFQLTIAPWMAEPFGKTVALNDVKISNFNGAAGAVHFWDQDGTNSGAPASRGSAGGALITVGFAASGASGVSASETTASVDESTLPAKEFRAGIMMQCTVLNVQVSANIRVIG